MPRAGGVAAKYGDRYEGRWTVLQLLRVLREKADWIRVEVPGIDEAEFAVGLRDSVEFHQVKRQRAKGPWNINALSEVLQGFKRLLADPSTSCTFVSTEPAKTLEELTDRANQAESVTEFEIVVAQNTDLTQAAKHLMDALAVDELPKLLPYLQRINVESVSERQLTRLLTSECQQLVAANPGQVIAVLGDLLADSISRTLHAYEVWQHIKLQGWQRAEFGRDEGTLAAIEKQNRRFLRGFDDLTIGESIFSAPEAGTVVDLLHDPDGPKAVLVTGPGGAGKSAVIRQVLDQLSADGWPFLALRADLLAASRTSAQLGTDIGIPASPAIVLATVPSFSQKLLVIDQLDAVSTASGRRTGLAAALEELFAELATVDGVRILAACREFDLQTDRRLRRLVADQRLGRATVVVSPWDENRILRALESLELSDPGPALLRLLATPLHLRLYVELVRQRPQTASRIVSVADLFTEYCNFKQQQVADALERTPDWWEVLEAVSDGIDRDRVLFVPEDLVDRYRQDAMAMISAGVLRRDAGRLSFFHEAFFDYVFARLFVRRGGDLVDYLATRDQDLFRRSQVRQALNYLRMTRARTFPSELNRLLASGQVRFHIKAVAMDVLGQIDDPRPEEWNAVADLIEGAPPGVRRRLLTLVRARAQWFELAVQASFISRWLDSQDPERQDRVIEILSTQQRTRPALVTQLLRKHAGRDEQWINRLRFIVYTADLTSSDRGFFEFALELLDDGVLDGLKGGIAVNSDFWTLAYGLSDKSPAWAAEFSIHYLGRQIKRARSVGENNPFSSELELLPSSQLGPQILSAAATGAPEDLAVGLVPLVLTLSSDHPADDGYHDTIWPYRIREPLFGMADAVRGAAELALRTWAATPSPAFGPLLAEIRAVRSATADYLVLAAYAGAGSEMADGAIEALLADGGRRLDLGLDAGAVIANASRYCSEALLRQLEQSVLAYQSHQERENPIRGRWGEAQFQLLSNFARGRLSQEGTRRLQELERKFVPTVEPVEPAREYGGFLQSPITADAAQHMSDEDWLRAMAKHNGLRMFDIQHPLRGGAEEFAQLFMAQFKEDPERFVALATRLPDGLHSSYYNAALFGSADVADRVPADAIWELCRHYHERSEQEIQKNLARLVERSAAAFVPDDILDLVSRIAIEADEPNHEVWQDEDRYSGRPVFGGMIDMAALNCTRGAAARALAGILRADPSRANQLGEVLTTVVSDRVYAVRAAAGYIVLALVASDDPRAVKLFERLVEGAPDELLSSQAVVNVLDRLLRMQPDVVLPLVMRMVKSPIDEVSRHGGRLAAVAWLLDLEPTEAWTSCGPSARAGAAAVFAGQIRYPDFKERCAPHLRAAFSDSEDGVREAATQVFWNLEADDLERLEDVCMDFLTSASRDGHFGHLIHSLDQSRAVLPRVVDAVATAFLNETGDRVMDIRFAEAAQAETVAGLVVRTYSAMTDRAAQERCLDLLDRLLELGAIGVEKSLADFER